MKSNLSIWQISLPICAVLMFAICAYTTIYMVDGRYRVEIGVNINGLIIKTDVDKQECKLAEDEIEQQDK
ncbi:hypothetical protein AMR41_16670 [Hapalosiphon sp. MRB220]|nr:hypothetical protein AMR41_16670 [Hapalosiphon sp. MRB220]